MEEIERPFLDLLPFLASDLYVPDYSHRAALVNYVANLFTRTEKRRSASKEISAETNKLFQVLIKDDKSLLQYAAALSLKLHRRILIEEVKQGWRKHLQSSNDHQAYFLEKFQAFEQSIRDLLHDRPYSILKAPKGSAFIITDNPIVTRRVVGQQSFIGFGFQRDDVHVLVPLTPRSCLQVGLNIQSIIISALEVDQINDDLLRVLHKEAYSHQEDPTLLQRLEALHPPLKYGVDIFKVPMPTQEQLLLSIISDLWSNPELDGLA